VKEPLKKYKNENNVLFILSGPSGVGKSTVGISLINFLGRDKIRRVVTTTTRPPRAGEVDGVDYFFVSKEKFFSSIKDGVFLEYAKTNDEYYGSSMSDIMSTLESDVDALLTIDVKGVEQILKVRENIPFKIVTIFLFLEDFDELRERIENRGSETEITLRKRLDTAKYEISKMSIYDFVVKSRTMDDDLQSLVNIYKKVKGMNFSLTK
jgi:guanylate kinase